jgi:hypothetical protein
LHRQPTAEKMRHAVAEGSRAINVLESGERNDFEGERIEGR